MTKREEDERRKELYNQVLLLKLQKKVEETIKKITTPNRVSKWSTPWVSKK